MQNFNILAFHCSGGDWFEFCFVGNPEDRFCHAKAHILMQLIMEYLVTLECAGHDMLQAF